MPIYEYICEACGEKTEFFQSIKDDPKTDCPSCGKPALKKMISLSSFHLKGSGWYVTDYGGKNGSVNGTGETSTASGTNGEAKKDSGDSSAKPASSEKADAKPKADKAEKKPSKSASQAEA